MFGAHEVRDTMKKNEELDILGKYLWPHVEKLV